MSEGARFPGRPRRVLIVRLSAIGDTILTTPLLAALKDAMPDVEVDWVIEPKSRPILDMAEGLSRIHVFPRLLKLSQIARAPGKLPVLLRDLRALRAEMAGRQYDLCFDVQGLIKSGVASGISGARWKVGWRAADSRELNWMFTSDRLRMPKGVHVVDAWLSMLGVIGLPATPARFPLRPPADALRAARDYIESLGPSGPIVIMNVGSSKPDRRWPAERFAEVARMAHSQTKALCVFTWGNDSEKELAGMAVEQAGEAGVLSLKTDLFLLAGLIRHADAFVGGDTGPMHLAAALGTPVAGVFGVSSAWRTGPYGPAHVTVEAPAAEAKGRRSPMDVIPPQDVYTALSGILSRGSGHFRRQAVIGAPAAGG